jgi:hypothetical protein
MFDESENEKGISQFGENLLILCHYIFKKKIKILEVSGRLLKIIFPKMLIRDFLIQYCMEMNRRNTGNGETWAYQLQ